MLHSVEDAGAEGERLDVTRLPEWSFFHDMSRIGPIKGVAASSYKTGSSMVVKTDICTFSELKIYPGRGIQIISKDSRMHTFLSRKCMRMFQRKIKSNKIRWATAWRRLNKKIKNDNVQKRRRKKASRVNREIVGMNLETIAAKQTETREQRMQMRQRALLDIKQRARKAGKTAGRKGRK